LSSKLNLNFEADEETKSNRQTNHGQVKIIIPCSNIFKPSANTAIPAEKLITFYVLKSSTRAH